MDLESIRAIDLTDSEGALHLLSERFGRLYSHDSLRNLVKSGKLRAFMFERGQFALREPGVNTMGKDLLFLIADLQALEKPRKVGRPAKN